MPDHSGLYEGLDFPSVIALRYGLLFALPFSSHVGKNKCIDPMSNIDIPTSSNS